MVLRTAAIAFAASILLASLAGCGGTEVVSMPDYGSEEGLKIAQVVSEFNDAKGDAKKFKKAFANSPPSNRKDYEKVTYEVAVGSPKIDGTTATAQVTIHKESNYEVIDTKEWTFVKVGDSWKIKSAPIP